MKSFAGLTYDYFSLPAQSLQSIFIYLYRCHLKGLLAVETNEKHPSKYTLNIHGEINNNTGQQTASSQIIP